MTSDEHWLQVSVEFDSETERRDLERVAGALEDELQDAELKVAVSIAPAAFDPTASGPLLLLAASTSLHLAEAAWRMAPRVLHALGGWMGRDRRRHVKLRVGNRVLELADASPEEQHQLVAAFVAAIETAAKGRGS